MEKNTSIVVYYSYQKNKKKSLDLLRKFGIDFFGITYQPSDGN